MFYHLGIIYWQNIQDTVSCFTVNHKALLQTTLTANYNYASTQDQEHDTLLRNNHHQYNLSLLLPRFSRMAAHHPAITVET
jgi:hypothetical protein